MSKRFTLAQAQRLIPQVEPLVRQAVAVNKEFQEAEGAVQATSRRIHMMGGVTIDRAQAIAARTRRDTAVSSLKAALEKIEEIGCQIKDLDIGLIDFLTLYHGREVCLCWKLGEPHIAFWHDTEEGFRGRKPINREFLENHRGDPV